MPAALLLMLGIGLGANLAATSAELYFEESLEAGEIALVLAVGGTLGALVALVVWDLTRQASSRDDAR
jgi:hypothetical protein